MSLFELIEFDTFVTSLGPVTLHDQWHARVAKIGPRYFAALGNPNGQWAGAMVFKTTPMSYEIMRGQEGLKRAPYTQRNWLAVTQQSVLNDNELRQYIKQSYELVSSGLTKKQRVELGIVTTH